ncbi:DUF397 domain-containing protein [Streptomyces sp. NBC_01190]|uniref:DUF397 domain-containing protein n=1 Tax=Streptomyces sp. NBC_01190 TaxID=2903767 RepID=UPI00386F59BD|nr:DUF397 domain-containing protein [Streptomyces sp. NBC_01190]
MKMADLSNPKWFKSSYSAGNGNCVEVAPTWRKSSHSSGNGQCVEVAASPDAIAVRDSKDPAGPALLFAPGEFTAFIRGIADGDFAQP